MEDTHGAELNPGLRNNWFVLILIVMEDTHGVLWPTMQGPINPWS